MKDRTIVLASIVGIAAVIALTGCTGGAPSSISNDAKSTNNQLNTFEQVQPIPKNTFSQYRQTVIDVEQAEIHGVATTTFFYNLGSNVPLKSCPSIGFPVAATSQLTNPEQVVQNSDANGNYGYGTVGQAEPNGVYTGDSTGTYVVCVQSNGDKRIDYWEGSVETEGGSATYNPKTGQITDSGSTTVKSTGKN